MLVAQVLVEKNFFFLIVVHTVAEIVVILYNHLMMFVLVVNSINHDHLILYINNLIELNLKFLFFKLTHSDGFLQYFINFCTIYCTKMSKRVKKNKIKFYNNFFLFLTN